ncbi:4-coumarate--CoA ligase-like 1 [Tripterygium wilfordii]|uniref:4-coumarate--CoA ligase-like 1 n=1 Tax=Tripterygium wilfordii TaxID=458696 RepID=A0A7J7BXR9_TRIWF|nr:4-coumarate--CoA ligase-like 1 [Tripterygium wilfordii]KAF5726661.1 4-coumarate--CoA ligase-like 1 [Tripterygium wilfordii]
MGGGKVQCSASNDDEHIFRSRFPAVLVPDNVTLPEFVLQGAELYADKVAFVESVTAKAYTYGEVVRDTRRFAKALRSVGLRKGNVVIVVLPNIAEYGIIALGIMSAGGVFSGVNPASHTSEIKKQLEAADAKLVVTNSPNYEKVKGLGLPVIVLGEERIETAMNWDELLEAGDRASTTFIDEEIYQTDLCALPFSSGTTGMSKGVMLTHRNLVANLCSSLFSVGSEMIGQVTTLGLIPFFHIYGIVGICCATLKNKGKVVILSRFELRTFLNALITQEVTFAPIVPPIILALVKNPIVEEFDLSKLKLRAVMTAAAPLAPELLKSFENKFPGVQVQEAYGLTEHSCITLTHGGHGNAKKNSVGFILPNLEIKFIDPDTGLSLPKNSPGEVCVRSQCVMQGYYNNKEETAQTIDSEGWLHTGDIGYIDDDGDVYIVDRIKELIKYKGFQVAPAELEAILLTLPSVQDAAVVPLADEEAGEVPAAYVVMNKEAQESEEDIIEFVASNVAHYKKVRVVQFVDSIPKSPSGKIMRRVLKEKIAEKMKKTTK